MQILLAILAALAVQAPAQDQDAGRSQEGPLVIGHAMPSATVIAPGAGSDSETGIGALIPWADRLWAVGYVAHIRGSGIGLYSLDENFVWRQHPASVTGTFANRLVHWPSKQAFIGPHAIDAEGNVRTIAALSGHRLTATALHLTDWRQRVYFLTMEGLLFEVDVDTLEATQLFDLVEELGIDAGQPHFKGMHSGQGRLVVANNTYEEPEHMGTRSSGRLAEWDGQAWTVLERNPFIEVSGKQNPSAGARYGNSVFAVGWDRRSVILRVLHGGKWSRYRLPKGSHSWDHTWNTEWMRIREAQTERYLLDAHGLFYELPALIYGDQLWGIQPISRHLRIVPDYCFYRGVFVMAGDQTDNAVGQPQSGLWFGQIDDLAGFGKATGWGGLWWKDQVAAGTVSDPYLMTGFDHKTLHLMAGPNDEAVVDVEVDFLGDGTWVPYRRFGIKPGGYASHVFPAGYSAHWLRLRVETDCEITAHLHYR